MDISPASTPTESIDDTLQKNALRQELIGFISNKTAASRLPQFEVEEMIDRIEHAGYVIAKKVADPETGDTSHATVVSSSDSPATPLPPILDPAVVVTKPGEPLVKQPEPPTSANPNADKPVDPLPEPVNSIPTAPPTKEPTPAPAREPTPGTLPHDSDKVLSPEPIAPVSPQVAGNPPGFSPVIQPTSTVSPSETVTHVLPSGGNTTETTTEAKPAIK